MDRSQKLDAEAAFNLTTELMNLRTIRYIAFNPDSLDSYGLDAPLLRLTVSLNGTNTLGQVILLGNAVEGGRYAMLQGQSVVFVFADKTAQALTRRLTIPLKPAEPEIPKPALGQRENIIFEENSD